MLYDFLAMRKLCIPKKKCLSCIKEGYTLIPAILTVPEAHIKLFLK
jgi:hypothetical protein